MMTTTSTRPAPDKTETHTLTASLVAARLEEGNTIQLLVAHPADPSILLSTVLPTPDATAAGPAAHTSFIESIGQPPFEGFMLLYGMARLTFTGPIVVAGQNGVDAGPTSRRVLTFEALDDAIPAPATSSSRQSQTHRPAGGARELPSLTPVAA